MIQVPVSVLESQSEHNLDCGIRHDDACTCVLQVQELASHLEVAEKVNTVNLRNTGLNDENLQKVTEAIAASLSEVEVSGCCITVS